MHKEEQKVKQGEDKETIEELKDKIDYLENNLKVVLEQYIVQRNNVLELQNKLSNERRKCRYERRRICKGA